MAELSSLREKISNTILSRNGKREKEQPEKTQTDEQTNQNPENNPFNDLTKSHNTSPNYEKPVLLGQEEKELLSAAIKTAQLNPIHIETPLIGQNDEHIRITLHTHLQENEPTTREIEITLEIHNFKQWASSSRLDENNGQIRKTLGTNGPYYSTITEELSDMVSRGVHMFFNLEEYDKEHDIAIFTDSITRPAYDAQWEK